MATISSSAMLTSLLSPLRDESNDDPVPSSGSASSPSGGENLESLKNLLLTLHFLFPHELLPALDLLDRKLVKRLKSRPPQSPLQMATLTEDRTNLGPELITSQHISSMSDQDVETYRSTSVTAVEVFYIQSASSTQEIKPLSRNQISSRFKDAWRGNAARAYYEVRLDSWNCTCSAFAQSQLKVLLLCPTQTDPSELFPLKTWGAGQGVGMYGVNPRMFDTIHTGQQQARFVVGGSATKSSMPIPVCKHILAAMMAVAMPETFAKDVEDEEISPEEFSGWAAGWGDL